MLPNSLLQILVVNPVREIPSAQGGKPFTVQDAECVMVNDKGHPLKVGVLRISRGLMGQVRPGVFVASFELEPHYKTRILEAQVSGLQPVKITEKGPVADGERIVPKAGA